MTKCYHVSIKLQHIGKNVLQSIVSSRNMFMFTINKARIGFSLFWGCEKTRLKEQFFSEAKLQKWQRFMNDKKITYFWLFLIIFDISAKKPSLEAIYNLREHSLKSKYALSNKQYWNVFLGSKQNVAYDYRGHQ